MDNLTIRLFAAAAISLVLGACSGVKTFPNIVRPGETAIVAAGWKHFRAGDISVTITPASGAPVTYAPGDPAIRGVINLYPDPVSSLVVSDRVGMDLTFSATSYADVINSGYTGGDRDWWQTTVYVDLPAGIAAGTATVDILSSSGETAFSTVEIIPGVGNPDLFDAKNFGPLGAAQIQALQRLNHYEVNISADAVPYAVQLKLQHSSSLSSLVYVVNPRGEIKNVAWNNNGGLVNIIMTPANSGPLSGYKDFKIYIIAAIDSTIDVITAESFDSNGVPVTGTIASISN